MITIDAQDKSLGRVASAAANALLGKHAVTFAKNIVADVQVEVVNASLVRISGDKERQKLYIRYSGYPGGQKKESYKQLTTRKGQKEAIRKAVLGMLPKNKLQARRIKLLTIKD